MSEVKPLILGLCSMNSFEIGEKKQRREKKKNEIFFCNEQACGLTRYVFYLKSKGCFWFLFLPVIKS